MPVISSITRIDYNELTGDLDVSFSSGNIYRYYGIPRDVYTRFFHAPSLGEFFVAYVRDQYPYRRERKYDLAG
jgi:KTSC domain-containing protein